MKYVCEIHVPDNDSTAKFDAMGKAALDESMWRPVFTRFNRLKDTDLNRKCGSCTHFCPYSFKSANGSCEVGHHWGPRSRPCCKDYERSKANENKSC